MDLSAATLIRALRLSVERPKDGARQILNLGLTTGEAWAGLLLMATLSTLTAEFVNAIAPFPDDEPLLTAVFASPFVLAVLQLTGMGCVAVMVHVIGRLAGGKGRFAEALVLVGWLQVILLALQFLQLVTLLVLPPLVGPLSLVGLALIGWLMTNFIAELHGFRSLLKVFLAGLAAFAAFSFLLALVLVLVFGVKP
jgi:hypothetical protein